VKLPSLRDLVDAELPLTEKELASIWRDGQLRHVPSKRETLIFLVVFFGPILALFGLGILLVDTIGYPKTTMAITTLMMCIWCCWAVALLPKRSSNSRIFRRELRLRGYDVCVSCGYWLRGVGVKTHRCPECGATMDEAERVDKK
jgi:hypothetical protein